MKRLVRQAGICLFTLLLATNVTSGEITRKLGIAMIDIPAGSFLMGSCMQTKAMAEENKKRAFLGQAPQSGNCGKPDPEASDNEGPQHQVNVRGFQISRTEVTLGQFKQFIAATGRTDLVNDSFMKYNAYGDSAPVVMVSWKDAQDFINWLNSVDGGGYRLPSEAEWEYACRAREDRRFCTKAADISSGGWWKGNSGERPRPVAQKAPNAFGLHDMSGNAWEWVQDCWHGSYGGAPTDGSAWTTECNGNGDERVMRGGSGFDDASESRAANRSLNSAGYRNVYIGFRLARTR